MAERKRVRAKSPEDRKTANMKFRTSGNLRERIETAADVAGRTASAEVERRLEASFVADDLRTIVREEVRAALREREVVAGARNTLMTDEGPVDWDSLSPEDKYALGKRYGLFGLPGPPLNG